MRGLFCSCKISSVARSNRALVWQWHKLLKEESTFTQAQPWFGLWACQLFYIWHLQWTGYGNLKLSLLRRWLSFEFPCWPTAGDQIQQTGRLFLSSPSRSRTDFYSKSRHRVGHIFVPSLSLSFSSSTKNFDNRIC